MYVTATLCSYRLSISYYSSNTGVYFNGWQRMKTPRGGSGYC